MSVSTVFEGGTKGPFNRLWRKIVCCNFSCHTLQILLSRYRQEEGSGTLPAYAAAGVSVLRRLPSCGELGNVIKCDFNAALVQHIRGQLELRSPSFVGSIGFKSD